MLPLFYHDRLAALTLSRSRPIALWLAAALMNIGCAGPAPTTSATSLSSTTSSQASTPPATAAPSSTPSAPNAPTANAVAQGKALIEDIRRASGGPLVTAFRSVEAKGTSVVSVGNTSRALTIKVLYPNFYRQEETVAKGSKGTSVTFGLLNDVGWMIGAMLGGDGRSTDLDVQQRTYTRASRQAMGAFLAGVNVPWLIDTGRYTATAGAAITAGPDRGLLILDLDGPDGRLGRLLVDPGTHLPQRLIQPPQPTGGAAASADTVITYSDFQPQAGLQLPHTITKEYGPVRIQWRIQSYSVNPKLPTRLFSRRSR